MAVVSSPNLAPASGRATKRAATPTKTASQRQMGHCHGKSVELSRDPKTQQIEASRDIQLDIVTADFAALAGFMAGSGLQFLGKAQKS